jgi:hypothetical protein
MSLEPLPLRVEEADECDIDAEMALRNAGEVVKSGVSRTFSAFRAANRADSSLEIEVFACACKLQRRSI